MVLQDYPLLRPVVQEAWRKNHRRQGVPRHQKQRTFGLLQQHAFLSLWTNSGAPCVWILVMMEIHGINRNIDILINKYTYIHTYIHTYVRTYIHTYIHTSMHACMHACIHTYIHTYLPTYVRTYVHACMHAYIPTYLPTYVRTYVHT